MTKKETTRTMSQQEFFKSIANEQYPEADLQAASDFMDDIDEPYFARAAKKARDTDGGYLANVANAIEYIHNMVIANIKRDIYVKWD